MARSDGADEGLAVAHLTAGYGGGAVVRDVSIDVGHGEAVALLGRNGAGKTTALMAIAGALRPMAGTVAIDGRPVAGLPAYRIARLGVSLVPQGRRIFSTLTVRENLTLGSRGGNLDEVHSLFPVLAKRAAVSGTALSGGEQQMLAIGRALMTRPRLLLMDEPSEGLAPQVVRDIGALVGRLRRELGLAVLIAEQNLALALAIADHVYVIERGEVVHQSSAAAFRGDPAAQKRYLGV
ncbi:MAG: hypothetical protein AUH40_04310 [Chloroflexi bacterium 13_1_40CM_65_17]|nr:MAG: hypothetical protein AUH40_04310 [Chloroflexi bacterium 13_1_40CM_65_17]